MGTSLTGLTPATTYDALIKVGDNGPLSATAKVLSDGLGNDSPIALSTIAVGIGTTTPNIYSTGGATNVVSIQATGTDQGGILDIAATGTGFSGINIGNDTIRRAFLGTINGGNFGIYTNPTNSGTVVSERLTITPAGNVGIGTSSPATTLSVSKSSNSGSGSTFPRLSVLNTLATQGDGSSTFNFSDVQVSSGDGAVNMFLATTYAAGTWAPSGQLNVSSNHPLIIKTNNTEVARFLAGGGLTFNGDTAAANALDDYEEGTWTPGFTLDSGTVTAHTASGSYTKIGRQVSLTLSITFTTTLLAEINNITGMPFTAQNTAQIAIGAIRESTNTGFLWHLRINANATEGLLRRYDNDQTLANGDTFIGTLTYFV